MNIGRKHPSRDVIFSGQNLAQKLPKIITSNDVLEPLKQVLPASRDAIISGQICGLKLQRVFTLGDGCWLPMNTYQSRFSVKKGVFSEQGGGNSVNEGLVRISTGKAIQ